MYKKQPLKFGVKKGNKMLKYNNISEVNKAKAGG